jgi:transcriptional regulator with XRE-family HTH domain
MSLGETLRRLREHGPRGKIRVTDVERDYGLSRQTLYLWESTDSRPEPVDLRLYCEWLDATEDQIRHVLWLRALPKDASEDDIPTLADPTTAPDAA